MSLKLQMMANDDFENMTTVKCNLTQVLINELYNSHVLILEKNLD